MFKPLELESFDLGKAKKLCKFMNGSLKSIPLPKGFGITFKMEVFERRNTGELKSRKSSEIVNEEAKLSLPEVILSESS